MPGDIAWFSYFNAELEQRRKIAEAQDLQGGYGDHAPEFYSLLHIAGNEDGDFSKKEIDVGRRSFDELNAKMSPHFKNAIIALLTSQVTGTWTAFEVLAGDLWESALNCRPRKLASLSAARGERTNDDKSQPSTSIQLNLLSKYGFDVRDKMGTILREKLSFGVLDKIRESYRKAFGGGDVSDVIASGRSPDPLNTLSFVRNVIVHRAGIADEDFETRADGHPHFGTIKAAERDNNFETVS